MARVLLGTSGYSYDDWVGPVYPPGTARQDFLSLYSREFPVVELNFSYYQQPNPRTLERMLAGTESSFTFAMKAHRSMTHEIGESWEKDIAKFRAGMRSCCSFPTASRIPRSLDLDWRRSAENWRDCRSRWSSERANG
jgi:uncharacterized protein YecE (DUF72 family)